MRLFTQSPYWEYIIVALILCALITDVVFSIGWILIIAVILGALPAAYGALIAALHRKISIDTFNIFALAVSTASGEIRSAGFIVLMLAFASLLEWRTATRAHRATEELLKLKPNTALVEQDNALKEIPINDVKSNDILLIKNGARIPVDGIVVYGSALINESSVSGESALIEKIPGDTVLSSTLNESGTIKIRATHVGKHSTVERMVTLMKSAALHKSKAERWADIFAEIFLPIVIAIGALTYYFTQNITMTAAIFLVACADDMAVAIPLAMTASIGNAAKKGVIVKGGAFFGVLGNIKTLIIDKTGTLTYGAPRVQRVVMEPYIDEKIFWKSVAIAEKFSEHPISRALAHEAKKYIDDVPDPDVFETYKGSGVWARHNDTDILIGDEGILQKKNITLMPEIRDRIETEKKSSGQTIIIIYINNRYAGMVTIADIPRAEARQSIERIKKLGIERIIMFTGDNEAVANKTAEILGIQEVRANMKPEDKLRELELLAQNGTVAMVGDGINDAPALSRAHIGIAMGSAGTAVAVEAADIVVLTDDLSRIPEMIILGRNTTSVIYTDMMIWLFSNMAGFALVLTGIAGPALAAFYNFATDFFPLINSARLFRK